MTDNMRRGNDDIRQNLEGSLEDHFIIVAPHMVERMIEVLTEMEYTVLKDNGGFGMTTYSVYQNKPGEVSATKVTAIFVIDSEEYDTEFGLMEKPKFADPYTSVFRKRNPTPIDDHPIFIGSRKWRAWWGLRPKPWGTS